MRIKIQQFLFGGTLFSWAIVGQNIGRALINLGHDVEFVSTDGAKEEFVPEDLKPYIQEKANGIYDCQISYTAMHNFNPYLKYGDKNRFGIWNYDGTVIPNRMIKGYKFCDKLLPSSSFSKDVFIKNGVPENKVHVIPHGIDLKEFDTDKKYPLKTNKKIKLLLNIATPHRRKNLKNTLMAYGKAFTDKDDVCLVIKVKAKYNQNHSFVDYRKILKQYYKKFKNAPEIEVITKFVKNKAELYNACDIVFQMSNLECWWLPGTEGFAAEKLILQSRHGGQLHYLNDSNSLLIDGRVVRMPRNYQYWEPNAHGEMFEPDIDDAVRKLRYAVENYDELLLKFKPEMKKAINKFNWSNVANQIMELSE